MSADSEREIAAWEHLAGMVTEQYPNLKVTFESAPYADYYTKLNTLAASNDLPCIISSQAQRLSDVKPLFTSLADRIAATPTFSTSDFDSSIMEGLQVDGAQVAIPYDFGPFVVFYNKDMFEAAGVDAPKPGWTKEDFAAAAKALTKDGKYGLAINGAWDQWMSMAVSNGGRYMTDDGALDLTDPKLIETFEWLTSLSTKDRVVAPVSANDDSFDNWVSGNAAMTINGPWAMINAKTNADFKYDIAPIPSFNGNTLSLTTGTGFGISQGCDNPEAAWTAIQVVTGADAQQYLAEQGRGFPARKAQQDGWFETAPPQAEAAITAALQNADPHYVPAKWGEISQVMKQETVGAFTGEVTASEALARVQNRF
jgi:ABC-type glycerol-3-phosphate transport system substrate-binding protein